MEGVMGTRGLRPRREGTSARHPRQLAAALVTQLGAGMVALSTATAQVPEAEVPPALQAEWQVAFAAPSGTSLKLAPRAATILSGQDEPLGYIQGAFSSSEPMDLRVLLAPAAFPRLPATAWPGAVAAHGDPAFPGLVRTSLSLRYDAGKDEMTRTYLQLEITPDRDGRYGKSEAAAVEIRLTRFAVTRGEARGVSGGLFDILRSEER
jgi:hypothetical protein